MNMNSIAKIFNTPSISLGIVGGFIVTLFGGFDIMLWALIVAVVLDYITGLIKGLYNKDLSSEVGYRGILKKVVIFIVVMLAVVMDKVLSEYILSMLGITLEMPLRAVIIIFFLVNEAISILENAASIGLPIPDKVKKVLIQLRDKVDEKDD